MDLSRDILPDTEKDIALMLYPHWVDIVEL